jgi:hypothetical protein
MDVPTERVETDGTKLKGEVGGKAGGEISIPFLADAKAETEGKVGTETNRETKRTFPSAGLQQVIREIGGSSFAVFVDDFHYIPKDVQKEIGQQIKEAAESGVRIITASVPHRSDDVVRSNTELRGRVTAIDIDYWSEDELAQIVNRGFREMNMDVASSVVRQLTAEAFGSPQLMQAIGLHFCFENQIRETLPEQDRIETDFVALLHACTATAHRATAMVAASCAS